MARKDKTGRSKGSLGRFVALPHHMLGTTAWRSLPPPARCAMVEILQRYTGSNNGRIAMSARVLAMALGLSRATAAKALADLSARGLVEVVKASSFSMKSKQAAEYRVTFHRCDVTGAPPSKTFMEWKPEGLNAPNVRRFPAKPKAA